MTLSFDNYISPNEILADALVAINDEEMKLFRIGWYQRQIHSGVKKLNYLAPYIETFVDLDMPEDCTLDVPSGAAELVDIFLWNGEDCNIESSVRVFHKQNFYSRGFERGYTARNKTGQPDAFVSSFPSGNSACFYNIHLGAIVFSDACAEYDHVRIVYRGFPKSINRVNYIPDFFREALVAWVVERAFNALQARDLNYHRLWLAAKSDLYQSPSPGERSKWDFAISRAKKLDKKHRDDLAEYLGRMDY